MTVMGRLADGGLLTQERSGRAYLYAAADSREELTATTMRERLSGMATADRRTAMLHFLGDATAEEIADLKAALAEVEQRHASGAAATGARRRGPGALSGDLPPAAPVALGPGRRPARGARTAASWQGSPGSGAPRSRPSSCGSPSRWRGSSPPWPWPLPRWRARACRDGRRSVALAFSAAMLARLLWSGHRVGTRLRSERRRHRELVDALGTTHDSAATSRWPGGEVRVLAHPTPTAYCLPGRRHRVVLTEGTLLALPR